MAKVLGNGSSLVTWEGSGHTAFTRSPCVDALVDEYLLSLSLPATAPAAPPEPGTRAPPVGSARLREVRVRWGLAGSLASAARPR